VEVTRLSLARVHTVDASVLELTPQHLRRILPLNKLESNWCNTMSEEEQVKNEASAEAENKELAKEEEVREEASEVKKEEATKEQEVKSTTTPRKTSREDNVVFIGNKPPMNYVMALITAFNMSDTNEVVLKARGRAISTAVDVAEITRNRFFKDAEVNSIAIGTEEIAPREGGNPRNVSTIEISLRK
jgi:DNA-binding protein